MGADWYAYTVEMLPPTDPAMGAVSAVPGPTAASSSSPYYPAGCPDYPPAATATSVDPAAAVAATAATTSSSSAQGADSSDAEHDYSATRYVFPGSRDAPPTEPNAEMNVKGEQGSPPFYDAWDQKLAEIDLPFDTSSPGEKRTLSPLKALPDEVLPKRNNKNTFPMNWQ